MPLKEPFQIVNEIKGGGLGQLFRCIDALGVTFAAKFPKDHTGENQRLVADEERRTKRHQGDHVVRYLQPVRHSDGRIGFAMELMDGSLSALVQQSGALRPSAAVEFFTHAAAGLATVHRSANGAFHGDIKLGNILYRGSEAKLADFGLARGGVGQTQMLGPHAGGTPGYLPPEGYASAAGDVYSLGVTLWAMLAGREPPQAGPLPAIQVTPQLADLINRMLALAPNARLGMDAVLKMLPAVRQECRLEASPDWLGSFLKVALGFAAAGAVVAGVGALLKKQA